ncbi:putative ribonuclease H-like domain-containing protein [Tanacetum coccineum]
MRTLIFGGVTTWIFYYHSEELPAKVNKARVIMSSATSAVTYTSIYTDSEPGRAFWGADDEEGIKRDYSVARTPQQNGVAERKNRILIEAARTMLADSKLPTMFWTEQFKTACYTRFKSNQPAGTQNTNTHAGPKVHTASAIVESTSDYAKELDRLQRQAYEANSTAKDTWNTADTIPTGSGVPTTSNSQLEVIITAVVLLLPSTPTSFCVEPVMLMATPTFLQRRRAFTIIRLTVIFSESTYDADFGGSDKGHFEEVQVCGESALAGLIFMIKQRKQSHNIPIDGWKTCTFAEGKRYWDQGFLKEKRCQRYYGNINDSRVPFTMGKIDEEVYVTQPKGFEDPFYPKHVYRVVKALYGLHQAPRAWYHLSTGAHVDDINFALLTQTCQTSMSKTSWKFDMESVRPATTPYEAAKPKSKDEPDDAVNVHLYRSMIGSLMYLTASRPDIMFAAQPKLGLWYPRDSPFVLEAYSDSDYAGSNGDRKSTTGGCQFLGRRLISWQCKKQT